VFALRRKSQVPHNPIRRHRSRLFDRRAVQPLGYETGARNRGAAPEYLEARFDDPIALAPHLDADHRPLIQRSNFTSANVLTLENAHSLQFSDALEHFV
jgi:hypothetical protein